MIDINAININLKDYIPELHLNIHIIKYIFIYFFSIILVSFILFLIISYLIINYFHLDVYYYNILFYDFNLRCKKILNLYGDYKINKIYLIREPLSKLVTFILNILTFYKYDKIIKNKEKIMPYHYGIICEILLPNGKEKLLLIEKNNSINISENFMIKDRHEFKKINLSMNKNFTINELLDLTQKRIGNKRFFNWSINKNNCRSFTKEILKTLKKFNKSNKELFFSDISINKLVKEVVPTIFTKHIINSIVNIFNLIEQYIYLFL